MSDLVALTELDAVNTMLDTIGEAPVNTLINLNVTDANNAIRMLHRTSRFVQEKGYEFNTEVNYKLTPTNAGKIIIPSNALRVDVEPNTDDVRVTQRGDYLYDIINQTYIFENPVHVRMVLFLAFEDLPSAARQYIMIKAARTFGDKMLGTDVVHEYSAKDEQDALYSFRDAEAESGDHNIFTDSWSVTNILNR